MYFVNLSRNIYRCTTLIHGVLIKIFKLSCPVVNTAAKVTIYNASLGYGNWLILAVLPPTLLPAKVHRSLLPS